MLAGELGPSSPPFLAVAGKMLFSDRLNDLRKDFNIPVSLTLRPRVTCHAQHDLVQIDPVTIDFSAEDLNGYLGGNQA